MAKKSSGGWDRTQVEEWAFSVAVLKWDNDRYWQCSRYEFIEIKKAYARANGIDVPKEMTKEDASTFSEYIKKSFGSTTT